MTAFVESVYWCSLNCERKTSTNPFAASNFQIVPSLLRRRPVCVHMGLNLSVNIELNDFHFGISTLLSMLFFLMIIVFCTVFSIVWPILVKLIRFSTFNKTSPCLLVCSIKKIKCLHWFHYFMTQTVCLNF